MAKINEELKAKIVFNRTEKPDPDMPNCKQVIISAEYKGMYRQFSFHVGHSAHKAEDVLRLEEEAKYILTHVIERAIKDLPI